MTDNLRFGAGFLGGLAAALFAWSCVPTWDPPPSEMTFELVGLHEPLDCAACHPADQPIGPLPTECAACHEEDRKDPGHYPGQDCGECHTPYGWGDVVVDHSFFPLEDAHDLPSCLSCHEEGTYEGLDPTCSSCHEADRPPGHFEGQDCGECHTPTVWEDGEFDHDPLFPLPHQGVSDCESCHLGGDTTQFSCIDCHEHNQADTNKDHDEVNGYQYNSDACLDCHPKGNGG